MAAGVIVTGNFGKDLLPNINKWFGDAYANYETLYDKIFDVSTSDRNFEEDVIVGGLGLAKTIPEGSAVKYDTMGQGFVKRYVHDTYGTGFVITRQMVEDGKSDIVSRMESESLKKAMLDTREVVAANVLNRAFTATYAGGDGKELCATDHPTLGPNLRNELSIAADFSEAAVEQAVIDLADFRDHRGLRIKVMAKKLIIPKELQFEAKRLLGSMGRVGTADNDLNTMLNFFPEGVVVNPYLTSAKAWFIKTDVGYGLRFFNRRDMEITNDGDFDTDNAKFKATMRLSASWSDPRGVFGSPGQ